jgi:hypothetical protein
MYRFDHEITGSKLVVRALVHREDLQFRELTPPTGANLYRVPSGRYELVDGFDSRTLGWIDTAEGSGSLNPAR